MKYLLEVLNKKTAGESYKFFVKSDSNLPFKIVTISFFGGTLEEDKKGEPLIQVWNSLEFVKKIENLITNLEQMK